MTVQTATNIVNNKLVKYFSSKDQLHTNESEIKKHYLSNRVKGLSFKLNLFEKDEHLEIFISKLIFLIECCMYADVEKDTFDSFVIHNDKGFLFIKKGFDYKQIPYFDEYIRTQKLPMIDKSEDCDEFPAITFAVSSSVIEKVVVI